MVSLSLSLLIYDVVPVDAAPVENQTVLLLEPDEVAGCDRKSVLTTSRAKAAKNPEKKTTNIPKNTARKRRDFHFTPRALVLLRIKRISYE